MRYFIATLPTPLLNQSDFSKVFKGKATNLLRALEMVALPGTVFTIEKEHDASILEVQTSEYRSLQPLYVDARFGKIEKKKPLERKRILPQADVIIKKMKQNLGLPYIWGGNASTGIPEILCFYPSIAQAAEKDYWTFKGVDCSGLIYEATNGAIPRNTQDLLFYGESVPIEGHRWEEIPEMLRPLDLVVWKGHMFILCDEMTVIESKYEWGGVCQTNLKKRFEILCVGEKKIPVDDPVYALKHPNTFLVRRFIYR